MATTADESAPAQTASLSISRDEAAVIREALKVLRNARVYSFKAQDEDIRQTHAKVLHTIERLDALLSEKFSR